MSFCLIIFYKGYIVNTFCVKVVILFVVLAVVHPDIIASQFGC